jgi:hypothetical protein
LPVFESMIALADEFAARVERSVGKRFEDVPASDLVSRAETDLLYGESERLITEAFGPGSDQMRYWKTTLEGDSEAVFNLYPDDEWRRWLYRMQRAGSMLRTLEAQLPSSTAAPQAAAAGGQAAHQAFISYTHRDERHADRLRTALAVLKSQGLLEHWHDRRIQPGAEWETEIDAHLDSADLVLLVVTPEFLASEYAFGIEVARALERRERGEAMVVPIIVRASDWMHSPLGKLQALPTDGKPIANWKNRDDAWLNVAQGIRGVVEKQAGRSG